jgi:Phosphoglycerate kinase
MGGSVRHATTCSIVCRPTGRQCRHALQLPRAMSRLSHVGVGQGVTKYMQMKYPGPLVRKEVKMLAAQIDNPKRPFAVVLGGSKAGSICPPPRPLTLWCPWPSMRFPT